MPHLLHHPASIVHHHSPVGDPAEQTFPFLNADCHEIRSCRGIVEILQAYGTSVVKIGIAGHNLFVCANLAFVIIILPVFLAKISKSILYIYHYFYYIFKPDYETCMTKMFRHKKKERPFPDGQPLPYLSRCGFLLLVMPFSFSLPVAMSLAVARTRFAAQYKISALQGMKLG
ncbi:MAG: hypothetical protein H6Q57_1503 [Geobacteraceae bacterium]|nr:hypothetical protein [Geobacteraceae bacterium]